MSFAAKVREPISALVLCLVVMGLDAQSHTNSVPGTPKDAQQYAEIVPVVAQTETNHTGKTDALLYQGKALARMSRLSEAERVLDDYLQLHPDSFEGLEALGAVQQRENKPADSLRTFTRAAKLHTPSSADLRVVSRDYVLLNDYSDAIRWLRKAVAFDPQNAQAWYDLGRCYYTQSSFPQAQNALNRAAELAPYDVKVFENLGLTLDAENRPSAAEKEYRRAVALARKEPHADQWPYLDYGTFLLDQSRAAEAVPQLQAAVAANRTCAECHALLGRALAATGNIAQGVRELEQAVALAPNDSKAHYQLGRLYHRSGDQARAKQQFALSAKLYESKSHDGSIQ